MSSISKAEKAQRFYKIYELMYDNPEMHVTSFQKKLNLYKSSVESHLNEMYEKKMLNGPYLCMRPHDVYKEYIYLVRCENPLNVCEYLGRDSGVSCIERGFGDWNVSIVSTRLLDFSLWEKASIIQKGVRYGVYTSKVRNGQKKKVKDVRSQFYDTLTKEKKERVLGPHLCWGEDDWKLFHIFKDNIRRKVNPLLQKIAVSYGSYKKWKYTLKDHCTFHVEYYPFGSQTCLKGYFLCETDYEESIKKFLLSLFSSTIFIEIGGSLLAVVLLHPHTIDAIVHLFYELKSENIINNFRSAVCNFNYKGNGTFGRKKIY